MKPFNTFSATVLCAVLSIPALSQYSFKFGKVSRMEVEMESYERDTTAGAVILCDIGRFNGNEFNFTRHIRIKILKKSGLNFGNWTFNTPTKGDFKVKVFNLEDGEIITEKATGNSIYNEEIIDGFQVYKVFAPGVRVGSVIDIFYSFPGLPFEWRFQEMAPVVYNSLTLEPNQYVTYTKFYSGFEPIETVSPYEWRATNLPAFKTEPFTSDYGNYITKFTIQLSLLGYNEVSNTWKVIIKDLLKHPRFGQIVSNSAFLNDFARELRNKNISVAEKVSEAYAYIQNNIKWSGEKWLYLSNRYRSNFLTDHVGNSSEINLFLYALLEKAGISAYPVALSTRDNGFLSEGSPSLNKLNYVVVMVEDGDAKMVLDAASQDLIPGMVSSHCLNGRGLLIKKDQEEWIDLNMKNIIYLQKQFVSISINPDGISKAKNTRELSGYGFEKWSKEFRDNQSDVEAQKNMTQKEFPDAKIKSYEITQNDKAVVKSKEVIEFDITDQIIDTGEELIFNPLSFLTYAKNPFKSEDRKYPVDFTYPKEDNTTVVVNIPAGYTISKIPESLKLTSPDGSVTFMYMANRSGSVLQFKAVLKLNRYVFDETEYKDLRKLFGEISKIVTTPIELVKATSR